MNPVIILAQLLFLDPTCEESCPYIPGKDIQSWDFITENDHWIFIQDKGVSGMESPGCPGSNMININGGMVPDLDSNPYGYGTAEWMQKRACTKWINKEFPERCAQFDQHNWEWMRDSLVRTNGRKDMHFCIDRYEWPNREGAAPWIMATWTESKKLCESIGKRLCTEDEWTFACEGEDALPYPNGYIRDSQKCNIDKPWKLYHGSELLPRGTDKCGAELERLWQGHVSGSDPQCVSPFGVHDMIGNVDEWTTATRPGKYPSILKGGYWGPVRTRCRPSTRNHSPNHTFYQQGFRCCSDIKQD